MSEDQHKIDYQRCRDCGHIFFDAPKKPEGQRRDHICHWCELVAAKPGETR